MKLIFPEFLGNHSLWRLASRAVDAIHAKPMKIRFPRFFQNPKNATFNVFCSIMSKTWKRRKRYSSFLFSQRQFSLFSTFKLSTDTFAVKQLHTSCYTYNIILKLFIF